MTLADHFPKCSKSTPQNNDFKTLTVANKTEVPIIVNVIKTLHTHTLVIPSAVANIK